jgi:membrane protease YdiL (CAAX protease family)
MLNRTDPTMLITGFSLAAAAYWLALRTFFGGGLGEEPGLRGVALPLLLARIGPRQASLILGVCWMVWHAPILWDRPPLLWIAQLSLTVSVSLILTFAWVRFRPSLWTAILFHGALNGWARYAADTPQGQFDDWQIIRLTALLLIALSLLPLRWTERTSRIPGAPQ